MAQLQAHSVRDFSKGVYSNVNPFLAPQNSVKHAINFIFDDEYGAAKVRLGSTIIGSQLVGESNSILGMHNFRDRNGSNHALLAAVNIGGDATSSIFNVATGASIRTGNLANAIHRFETYLDSVIFVNGTDVPLAWDGTGSFAASTALNTASMQAGSIDIINYKDRLWTLTAGGVLYGSSIPASPNFNSISWTSGNKTIAIDPDSTSYTGAGIGLARVSGLLLIFKERALYTFSGSATQADFLYNVGCSSVRSIATGAGSVFFFNPDGVWVTKGSEPVRISRPVQAYVDGMSSSNYSSVAGHANGKYYWCSIGDVTIGLVTYSNVVLRYSISTQEWAVLSYATRPTAFSQYINGTAVTISYGDTTARCYTLDSGTTDNSTAIEFEIISHEQDFGDRAFLKDLHDKLIVYTKDSSDIEVSIRADGREFVTVGHALKQVDELPLSPYVLSGNFFDVRFVGNTSGASPIIYGYEFPNIGSSGKTTTE